MKKKLLALLVAAILAAGLAAPASLADTALPPCLVFEDGTDLYLLLGQEVTFTAYMYCVWHGHITDYSIISIVAEHTGPAPGPYSLTLYGLALGTSQAIVDYVEDPAYSAVTINIHVVEKLPTEKASVYVQPSSPFVLTAEFAALLPEGADAALTLTPTKFLDDSGAQIDLLIPGLWAPASQDGELARLAGAQDRVQITSEGYANPGTLAFFALPAETRTVTAEAAWGRATPNSTFVPLLTLAKDDDVYYLCDNGFWALALTMDGRAAYVAMEFLSDPS